MKIESKLKKYPGHIVLPDFMTLEQVREFETAYFGDKIPEANDKFVSVSVENVKPFLFKFVTEWKFEAFPTPENEEGLNAYPYSVLLWAGNQVMERWREEIIIPNE